MVGCGPLTSCFKTDGGSPFKRAVIEKSSPTGLGGRALKQPVSLFRNVLALLRLAGSAYPKLVGYYGALYTGVAVETVYDREIAWPTIGPGVPYRRRAPEKFIVWSRDETRFRIGDDPLAATRQMLKSLCWLMRYQGYESYLDRWGSALPPEPT